MKADSVGGAWASFLFLNLFLSVHALALCVEEFPGDNTNAHWDFIARFRRVAAMFAGLSAFVGTMGVYAIARLTSFCSSTFSTEDSILNELRKSFHQDMHCQAFVNTMKLKPLGVEFLGLVIIDKQFFFQVFLTATFRAPVLL